MFWEKKIMSIQLCPWSNGAPKYVYLHSNMNNRVLIMCKVKLKAIGSFISFFENAIPPPPNNKGENVLGNMPFQLYTNSFFEQVFKRLKKLKYLNKVFL
jgi:hypothetical protein